MLVRVGIAVVLFGWSTASPWIGITAHAQETAPRDRSPSEGNPPDERGKDDRGWQGLAGDPSAPPPPSGSTTPRDGTRRNLSALHGNQATAARTARPIADVFPPGSLPTADGQSWKEYDIRLFSQEFSPEQEPERFVLEWILRETGTDTWFCPPVGVLNVSRNSVKVYQTAAIQTQIDSVVQRVTRAEARRHRFAVRGLLVGNSNWRTGPSAAMQPMTSQTPGVEAWTLTREGAIVLWDGLRRRGDARELFSDPKLIRNGETYTWDQRQARSFPQSVQLDQKNWPGYQLGFGQIREGLTLAVSPLLSLDQRMSDVVVRGSSEQIEKTKDTWLNVPSPGGVPQRVQVQSPQVSGWQIHERFQWPVDEVLVISRSVIAPCASAATAERGPLVGGKSPLAARARRVEALFWIECRGPEDTVRAGPAGVTSKPDENRSADVGRVGPIPTRGRY